MLSLPSKQTRKSHLLNPPRTLKIPPLSNNSLINFSNLSPTPEPPQSNVRSQIRLPFPPKSMKRLFSTIPITYSLLRPSSLKVFSFMVRPLMRMLPPFSIKSIWMIIRLLLVLLLLTKESIKPVKGNSESHKSKRVWRRSMRKKSSGRRRS